MQLRGIITHYEYPEHITIIQVKGRNLQAPFQRVGRRAAYSGDPETIKPEYNEAIPMSKIAARPKVKAWLEELLDEEE